MDGVSAAVSSEVESEQKDDELAMNDHVASIDSGKMYECKHPGCGAAFSKPSKLTIHVRQHTGERPYKCDQDGCDKSYTSASHLKRHCQTHSMVKQSFKCSKCSMIIANKHNLKRHYERAHSRTNPFSCEECGLKFRKEQKYKEHEATHRGVVLYKCEICSKQFMALNSFKKHEQSHDSKKEYRCTAPNCAEVFGKWSLLCKHKKSKHISEYKCKDCDKVFLNKTQLKSHSLVHADDRSILQCPYEKCPRFYFFKRNLDHHYRTSHLGKKYHCDICDVRLSSKQKITEHIGKIHMAKKKKKRKKKKTLDESERKPRKDSGVARKSMLSKLAGLNLPRDIEKELLNRKTKIQVIQESRDETFEKNINNAGDRGIFGQMLTNGCKEVINNATDNASVPETDDNQIIHESSHQLERESTT